MNLNTIIIIFVANTILLIYNIYKYTQELKDIELKNIEKVSIFTIITFVITIFVYIICMYKYFNIETNTYQQLPSNDFLNIFKNLQTPKEQSFKDKVLNLGGYITNPQSIITDKLAGVLPNISENNKAVVQDLVTKFGPDALNLIKEYGTELFDSPKPIRRARSMSAIKSSGRGGRSLKSLKSLRLKK